MAGTVDSTWIPMRERISFELIGGPYAMPRCRVGGILTCEVRGRDVRVGGVHDAPISWPTIYRGGPPSLIVCGDLIRALKTESAIAVAHHWGVALSTVCHWRQALGVPRWTPGTTRLIMYYFKKGQKKSLSATARAKHSATRRGRPLSPEFRAAALRAAKRPKSAAWKRKMSAILRKHWAAGGIRTLRVEQRRKKQH